MSDTKLRPVRLCDVPLKVRLHAARGLCQAEHDQKERLLITTAAMFPSDKTYYLPAAA
jgi:hypothetical protein